MSDFGDFNSSADDPTADFLARERAILGDDADRFDAASLTPELSAAPSSKDQYSSNMSSPIPADTSSLPVSETSAFESDYPRAEELESSQAFFKATLPDEEPEVVRQWREKQKELIAERDAKEEANKAETIRKAREDIDKFYEEYNEKKEKAIAENREREEETKNQRDASTNESVWERVYRECEFSNAKSANPKRDVSRMKDLIKDLRKDQKAPGIIVGSEPI